MEVGHFDAAGTISETKDRSQKNPTISTPDFAFRVLGTVDLGGTFLTSDLDTTTSRGERDDGFGHCLTVCDGEYKY